MRLRLKEPFPLLAKELLELAVRKRTYVVRVVYALALFAIFAYCYYHWNLTVRRAGMGGGRIGDSLTLAVKISTQLLTVQSLRVPFWNFLFPESGPAPRLLITSLSPSS